MSSPSDNDSTRKFDSRFGLSGQAGNGPHHPTKDRWLLPFLPWIVLFCLSSVTALFWWTDYEGRRQSRWKEFQTHTALTASQMAIRLENHFRAYVRALERLRQQWFDIYRNDEPAFRREAIILCQLHPGLRAVNWVDSDYVLRWTEPRSLAPKAEGTDYKLMPERLAELRSGSDKQKPVVSPAHELLQGGRGFLVSLPLQRQAEFGGFVQGEIRVPQFVDDCLIDRAGEQFHIELVDGGRTFYAFGQITPEEYPKTPPLIERRVVIGGRVWEMRLQPSLTYYAPEKITGHGFLLLGSGLALSLVLSITVWQLQQRNQRLADQHDLLRESDQRLREKVRSLHLLNELGVMLGKTFDLGEVFDQSLHKIRDAFGLDMVGFFRFDAAAQVLNLEAHDGVPPEMLAIVRVQSLGTRFAGRAAQTGEMLVVDDVSNDPREDREVIRQLGIRQTVYLPVKHRGEVLGLVVMSYRSEKKLQPADLELLPLIADTIGMALSNARLFEEVRSSQEFFQSLFNAATDAVLVENLDSTIIMASSRASQMLGYSVAELIGKSSFTLFAPEDQAQLIPMLRSRFLKDREMLFEAAYQTKDGAALPVEISTRIVHIGEKEMVLTFSRDLTVRRRLEQELLQAKTMESVGTLAGGIAHDFNNLLSSIIGFGTLALTTMKPGDQHYSEMLQVVSAAERAASLVQQLLTLSRKSPPKLRPLNVNDVVDQVFHLLPNALPESIEVHARQKPDLPAVNADPIQLEQVLMNLCLNARDAILQVKQAGVVTVRTMTEELTAPAGREEAAVPAGRYVTLMVSDDGCGMDEETRLRLFQPFFTTKRGSQGTGLGLAMVFGIVKSHHGYIDVESAPGQGSTFRIRFPAIDAPAQPLAEPPAEAPTGNETLLLVDDDLSVLDLTRIMLERYGYNVVTARDAIEGLETYKKQREQIALVITDLIMPRVSGAEFIGQLRKIDPALRIIVSTGYSADAMALPKSKQQPNAAIQKPFRMTELAKLVRVILDGGPVPETAKPPDA
jgi:PAS domain S-box-containing protein